MKTLALFSILISSSLVSTTLEDDVPASQRMAKFKNGNEIHYTLRFKDDKPLIRFSNRFFKPSFGSFIRNVHVSQKDLRILVRRINQHDLFRGGLNSAFQPGVSTSGLKLRKRPQSLMYDMDPETPISEEIHKTKARNGTRGYSTQANIRFAGLSNGDTLFVSYNSGRHSKRQTKQYFIDGNMLDASGNFLLKLPLGNDKATSTNFGILIKFGRRYPIHKFDTGTVSYNVDIERKFRLPKKSSARPLNKRSAKNRWR